MLPNPAAMWSSIVKKDPPSKPPKTYGAPVGLVGNCKSTKGISIAVVDANVIIEGRQSLTNLADRFVTVPEVLFSEIRDHESRRRLDLTPFTIETMEPSPESLTKVIKFAESIGELRSLSVADRKLIALTYTLEAQFHGTKHLRDAPMPVQTVKVLKRLPDKELPGWGSNVANLEEWEALENETEEDKSNSLTSKILPLQDLDMNIIAEDEQEGERNQKRYTPKITEVNLAGKMVVEGIDASQGEYDDEDTTGDWRPAVSSSTHRKFLRRKAKWERYNALAEQDIQRDLAADKAEEPIEKCAKDIRKDDDEDTNAETTLSNGENDIEVKAEGIDVVSEAGDTFEADDGSSEQSLRSLSESSVACITGDYAMQNVILQMGLRLLAPGGMQIRQINRWVGKCHVCYTVTSEMGRLFCPRCANLRTLCKVPLTVHENGTIIAGPLPRIRLQGTKFSIPDPIGGREGITKNLVLREDQLPLRPKTKKKASRPGDEHFVSDDVFMNHHSNRNAPLQPPLRRTMAIFSQTRNPNDNHYSRSMH